MGSEILFRRHPGVSPGWQVRQSVKLVIHTKKSSSKIDWNIVILQ